MGLKLKGNREPEPDPLLDWRRDPELLALEEYREKLTATLDELERQSGDLNLLRESTRGAYEKAEGLELIGKSDAATVANLRTKLEDAERDTKRNRALQQQTVETISVCESEISARARFVSREVASRLRKLFYETQTAEVIAAAESLERAMKNLMETFTTARDQFRKDSLPVKSGWTREDAAILPYMINDFSAKSFVTEAAKHYQQLFRDGKFGDPVTPAQEEQAGQEETQAAI